MAGEIERARKALRELGKSLKSLPSDLPPDDVHKLRTATRRVEAIAAVLERAKGTKSRRLLKSIEPIRKAAGSVRDMDVLASNARRLSREASGESIKLLIGHLEVARQQNAEELQRVISRRRDRARKHLKRYAKRAKSSFKRAKTSGSVSGRPPQTHDGIHTAAVDAVRELNSWPALNVENIHEFRLKVKDLRYILQLSGDSDPSLVGTLANVQRRIGDWHDWQQLGEIAHEVLNAERDHALLNRIQQMTQRRLDRAITTANALRSRYLATPFAPGA